MRRTLNERTKWKGARALHGGPKLSVPLQLLPPGEPPQTEAAINCSCSLCACKLNACTKMPSQAQETIPQLTANAARSQCHLTAS